MPNAKPDPGITLRAIASHLLSRRSRAAMLAVASLGYGAARNLPGILMEAKAHNANVRAVAAAFGFLPDLYNPAQYLDVLLDDECLTALLPADDPEVIAAFALSRAVCPPSTAFVV